AAGHSGWRGSEAGYSQFDSAGWIPGVRKLRIFNADECAAPAHLDVPELTFHTCRSRICDDRDCVWNDGRSQRAARHATRTAMTSQMASAVPLASFDSVQASAGPMRRADSHGVRPIGPPI